MGIRRFLFGLLLLPLSLRGAVLDLQGGTETLHVTNVLRAATVLTNGTFIATNHQLFTAFPVGTVTVAAGARLVFPAEAGRNIFHTYHTGLTVLEVSGGEVEVNSWREENGTSHHWGYGLEKDITAVLRVTRDGGFRSTRPCGAVLDRYYFTVGFGGHAVPTGILIGVDSPNRGFDFAGRVCLGWQAVTGVYCTNTLFRAENIVFGGVTANKHGGYAEAVFAGGSVVETKGFCGGFTRDVSADVLFDGATVRARPTAADDALNAQTNFFGGAADLVAYAIGPGGLTFDNGGCDVTIAYGLNGTGPLTLAGAGTTRIACDQPLAGELVVGPALAFRPARNLVFAGPVAVTDEAALERPEIPAGHNHVRLFSAAAVRGLTGRKDAQRRHFFTIPGRFGVELHWGARPGTEVRVR